MKFFLFLFFIFITSVAYSDVIIFKQWHLSPKEQTTNITFAKKLPQFKNQESIFLKAKKMIEENKSQMIISEGCGETQINENFDKNFNGWDYKKLKAFEKTDSYSDILTLLGLKLEVLFKDKVLTFCGDNENLLKEHQLALSDLRAYYGYFIRLKEYKIKNLKLYATYVKSLNAPKGEDPILYARKKGQEALKKFKDLIVKRNESFIKMAINNNDKNPIIIIGGLHANDLQEKLQSQKIKVQVISEESYEREEKGLFDQLEKAF